MPQLIVRNIEIAVVDKLRQRAASEGISMEEVHRRILRDALLGDESRPKKSFKEFLASMPNVGDDVIFSRPRSKMRKLDL